MIAKGQYISEWEEGDVVSECFIDLVRGEIVHIETSDEGADYEHHIQDQVQVDVDDKYIIVDVEDEILDAKGIQSVRRAIIDKLSPLIVDTHG